MFTPTAQPFPGRQSSVRTVSNGVVYARTRGDEGGGAGERVPWTPVGP